MKLEVWNTPFSSSSFPHVAVIPDPESCNSLWVIVGPSGIDQYPKYLVRFNVFGAYKCDDESLAAVNTLNSVQRSGSACSYIWEDSPWLSSFNEDSNGLANNYHGKPLRHFIFLGGDLNVEILAPDDPTIEKIDSSRAVCEYKV